LIFVDYEPIFVGVRSIAAKVNKMKPQPNPPSTGICNVSETAPLLRDHDKNQA